MKLPALLLALALLTLPACQKKVIVVVRDPADAPPGAKVIHVPDDDPATIAEIDAAARLSFDPYKQDALSRIARREGLPPGAQVHLVDVTIAHLSFDPYRIQVLKTLIRNPTFANAGKTRILQKLDQLSFDPYKQDVLQAISDRGTLLY